MSFLRLVINGLLGLALVVFTMSSVPSHGGFGSDAHPLVTLHADGPHAAHEAGHDGHSAGGLCGTACAVSIAPLPERGPELARARGVPPAIVAGIEEHSPDDPLPPPRSATKT